MTVRRRKRRSRNKKKTHPSVINNNDSMSSDDSIDSDMTRDPNLKSNLTQFNTITDIVNSQIDIINEDRSIQEVYYYMYTLIVNSPVTELTPTTVPLYDRNYSNHQLRENMLNFIRENILYIIQMILYYR